MVLGFVVVGSESSPLAECPGGRARAGITASPTCRLDARRGQPPKSPIAMVVYVGLPWVLQMSTSSERSAVDRGDFGGVFWKKKFS